MKKKKKILLDNTSLADIDAISYKKYSKNAQKNKLYVIRGLNIAKLETKTTVFDVYSFTFGYISSQSPIPEEHHQKDPLE